MANRLECEIVQDLLPLYVDELTSEKTNQAIEEHIAVCASCKASLEAMRSPEDGAPNFEEKQEIDFLKKTKKKTRRTVLGSVVAAVAIICVILFVRFYLVGSPLYGEAVACKVDVSGSTLNVSGAVVDSGLGVSDVIYSEENGVVTISFKATLASPFNTGDFQSEYMAAENITQVRIGERIIWDQGKTISAHVSAVYNTKHPYVGEMPANGETANALGISVTLGSYQNELQTTEEPYGWTFLMENDVNADKVSEMQELMNSYAYVLMAVIDNLNVVSYEYTVDGEAEVFTITSEMATEATGKNIKEWGLSPASLQELMESLGLDSYAAASGYQGMSTETIFVRLVNGAEDDIYNVSMEYYLDGEFVGSKGVSMAVILIRWNLKLC